MSNSLWPHGLQHARFPCSSLFPEVSSNSCPLSQWCLPTISSSVTPFSCPQSFPASGSFPMSQLFTSGHQRLEIQLLASVLPVNIQGCFPFGLTGLIPCSPRNSQEFSLAPHFKRISSSVLSLLYGPASHPYLTTGKTMVLTIWTFVSKAMSLLFNMLSRFS